MFLNCSLCVLDFDHSCNTSLAAIESVTLFLVNMLDAVVIAGWMCLLLYVSGLL